MKMMIRKRYNLHTNLFLSGNSKASQRSENVQVRDGTNGLQVSEKGRRHFHEEIHNRKYEKEK